MIRKVRLRHWGIYRNEWHSPVFHDLVDMLGGNGSGKSTLIDGISVALGLTHEAYLFDNRSVGAYVNDGREAIITLLLDNPIQANGKRRFSHIKEDLVTAGVRVRPKESPQSTFILRGGDIRLNNLAELTKEWMSAKDYEVLWRKAHLPKQQRLQRIFRVNDIKRVEKSDKRDLDNLFREYCSDPAVTENLNEALDESRRTTKNLRVLADTREEVRREHREAENNLRDMEALGERFKSVRFHEAQYHVAHYHSLKHEYDALLQGMKDAERQREQHEQKLLQLQGRLQKAEHEARQASNAADEQQKSADKAKHRYLKLDEVKTEAIKQKARVEAEQESYADLKPRCRSRTVVEGDLAKLQKQSAEAAGRLAQSEALLDKLENRLATLRDTGVAPEISLFLDALREADIQFKEAREFLPDDRSQGYEEAVGRARYGILVSKKQADAAWEIARQHRYPGPVSTLDTEQYATHVFAGPADRLGFETPLGKYAIQGDEPVLNPNLREVLLTKLDAERSAVAVEIRGLEERQSRVTGQINTVHEEMGLLRQLEKLEAHKREWAALLQQAESTIEEAELAHNYLLEVNHVAAQTKTVADQAESERQEAQTALEDEQSKEPAQLASSAEVRRLDLFKAEKEAQPFIDRVKSNYGDPGEHWKAWKDGEEKLKGMDDPPKDDIAAARKHVDALEEEYQKREKDIHDMEVELKESSEKIKRLRTELEADERSKFRAFKKRVKELGARYDVTCEVDRYADKKEPGHHLLDFKVSNRTNEDGEAKLESIRKSSSSTGENTKACIVFMMALTPDDQKSFYIFDEPAAAFSEENLEDMWQIFREMGHQVIITSTKPGDYGEDDVDIQLLKLQAEAKSVPNRKALSCMEGNAVFGREAFRVAV